MISLLDGEYEELIGHYWIGSNGYAYFGNDQLVHRTIMSSYLGRELIPPEVVHHKNYNKLDNRIANLQLCKDSKEHKIIHAMQDMLNDGANPETEHYCTYHKTYHLKENFSFRPSSWNGLHNMCREGSNEYRRLKGLGKDKFDWRAMSNQQYRRALKKNVEISWLSKEGRGL